MKMDIDSLIIFEAIVSHGSFSKAAIALNRAQSNISYKINKLEEDLGTLLFDRTHYRAKLTNTGRQILQESKKLLAQASHIRYLADSYDSGWEPEFMIVIDGALPIKPMMNVLQQIASQSIPTKIVVKVEFLSGVQKRFLQAKANFMLVKDYIALPSFIGEPLPVIDNYLVVSNTHPLASINNVSREQLMRFVELTVNDSADNDYLNQAHQFGGDRVFYFSSFIDKKHALLMDLGFGWMPEFLIRDELDNNRLKKVDYVGGNQYQFSPKLVYSDECRLGKAAKLFKKLLLQQYIPDT
jgi:DNA-binding transcriptional LysR family regulator